jgi:hypothetical protein
MAVSDAAVGDAPASLRTRDQRPGEQQQMCDRSFGVRKAVMTGA